MELQLTLLVTQPSRLDQALLPELQKRIPSLSRAELKRWFADGRILMSGRPQPPARALTPGAHPLSIRDFSTELMRGASALARPCDDETFLENAYPAYEDEELLILHKDAGVPSVPHSSDETNTAVGAALARVPSLVSVGKGGLEPGLLHRLDTGTSGLLAFAKTQNEWERLKDAWKSGGVRKTYRAFVTSRSEAPPLPRIPALLKPFLAHDAKSNRRMVSLGEDLDHVPRHLETRGAPLRTLTRIVRAHAASPSRADLELEIETGVMHQIRCTVSALGWPILGDDVYRGAPASRLWLHAWKLSLVTHEGVQLTIESRLPEDWPIP